MTDYTRDGETIVQDHDDLRFRASSLRMERQHPKATVEILLRSARLDIDDLNLGTRATRNTLANSAHALAEKRDWFEQTKEQFQHLLMEFVVGLWDFHTGDQQAVLTRGDTTPSRPEWLIEDVVLREGGTILFRPPGGGKSYIGMLMAQSLNWATDQLWTIPLAGRPIADHHSLYINLERSERSMQRRLGQVNAALRLDRDAEMLMIHARGGSLAKTLDGAARTIRDQGCSFVVLDSLSRAGAGDLTQNGPANDAMDMLNGLGVAWLALAHTPRDDESHAYGSQMFDAAADLAIRMYTEVSNTRSEAGSTGSMGVALRVTKTNDTGYPDPKLIVLNFSEFGLREAYIPGSEGGFSDMMMKARGES